jgi:BRCT domain type II-containing protein
LFSVSHEQQSKDVMDKTQKMKLKDNTVSSAATTKTTSIKTTTATTSKTDSKWLATSSVSATAASDKLKPLVTHELSVVSWLILFLRLCWIVPRISRSWYLW